MSKYTKIDIFLLIGFLISAFSFSLTISNIYRVYNEVVEKNEFNKNYKYLDIGIGKKEVKTIDGYKVTGSEDDENDITLKEVLDEVNNKGYEKIILNPLVDQIKVNNDFFINNIWPCSMNIDIKSKNIISGRYLTNEELNSNDKVAVIGSGMERLVEEKNGENYIKIFDEYYKVIGVIGNTEMFKYSSIIPLKSLSSINSALPKYTFWEYDADNTDIKDTDNKNMNIIKSDIPKIPVIDYLFQHLSELKNSLYQVFLGIINLFMFSYFFAKGIKEKIAIMKVLGARNIDIFKEVFFKFIKISSVGVAFGLVLSKFTVDFMIKSFPTEFSAVNAQNILLTFIIVFIISLTVSIGVLFNVLRFKIMKEIR